MLKKITHSGARILTGLLVAGTLAGGIGVATVVAAPGGPHGSGQSGERAVGPGDVTELNSGEIEGIIEGIRFMSEEEKLARDVYNVVYELWGQPVFRNIASSEQAHMDAIRTLIERYGVDDPAAGNEPGKFTDEDLQGLYDELVEKGSESLEDALRVGAAIEEIDIQDLQMYMEETEAADVLQVYENLMRGSRNHLRAFVSTLERQSREVYEPEYLDQDLYEDIIENDVETGGSGQRGGRSGPLGSGSRSENEEGRNQSADGARGRGGESVGGGRGPADCSQ